MAKTKADLLAEAKALGLELNAKSTIADITAAIKAAGETVTETVTEAVTEVVAEVEAKEVKTAKAGKRSAKGLEEAEAKAEKIEHQKHRDEAEAAAEEVEKARKAVKPTRSRLERRSKGFRKSAELVEKGKVYSLAEALALVPKTSSVKFDATVELHINLGVDPRQADQNIRASLVLPAGTGKAVRVAVFADDKVAGADVSGIETIVADLEKGVINFDTLVTNPQNMPKLGKYARLLGPRGLMPNPKSGTVTTDLAKAVEESKAGRVEYRVDSTGIIHVGIGKVSFTAAQLQQNADAVMSSIKSAKPQTIKGTYIKAVHIASTMGPSITVNPNE